MDFTGYHYYRINRILLISLGLWPYHTQRFSSFIIMEYNTDLLLHVLSILCFTMYYAIKYISGFINSNKMKELIEQIQYDWNSLKEEEELKIIRNRANIARSLTILLLTITSIVIFLFMLMFFSPNILDIIIPLNESRQPWQLPPAMEFFFDQHKYVYLLTIYFLLTIIIGTFTVIGIETFMIIFVQHICAMFQITR
ncbi:hypothetical protein P5V15_004488 [Pogonomyrmex californicus]